MNADLSRAELRRIAADVVSAYVSYNTMPNTELSALVQTVHGAFSHVGNSQAEDSVEITLKPAVPFRRSIQQEYIICLEDDKNLKMLKRYLRSRYNLTPDEYRRK